MLLNLKDQFPLTLPANIQSPPQLHQYSFFAKNIVDIAVVGSRTIYPEGADPHPASTGIVYEHNPFFIRGFVMIIMKPRNDI